MRHFNLVSLMPFDDESLRRIFGTIIDWWSVKVPCDLSALRGPLVDATIALYATACKQFRPTPAKSHYTFNLRDISKVFQGILSAEVAQIRARNDLIRLWAHECSRVFCDRLITEQDILDFEGTLVAVTQRYFSVKYVEVLGQEDRQLIYCDFIKPGGDRGYVEVKDDEKLHEALENLLNDYNNNHEGSAHARTMNLVLFRAAIEHVAHIARVIRQPYGHALLVGMGGSGRQSLTRLAASIEGMHSVSFTVLFHSSTSLSFSCLFCFCSCFLICLKIMSFSKSKSLRITVSIPVRRTGEMTSRSFSVSSSLPFLALIRNAFRGSVLVVSFLDRVQ